jgi:hypothetical protein
MPSTLARSFRAHLENKASSPPLAAVLNLADEFVLETPDSIDQLEQELERIHDELVDHATLYPSEAFLAVLFHLLPILRQKSVISTWFDLLLRPALREPKLSTAASSHAKLIVLSALDEESSDIVANFRRRLFDLYLLDAFNEGSGADVIEWAQLTPEQRAQKSKWKANLEDILLRFGKSKPQVSCTLPGLTCRSSSHCRRCWTLSTLCLQYPLLVCNYSPFSTYTPPIPSLYILPNHSQLTHS